MTNQNAIQTITDRQDTERSIILAHLLPAEQHPQLDTLAGKAAKNLTDKLWPEWAYYNTESLSMDEVGNTRYAAILVDQADNLTTANPQGYAILDYKPEFGILVLEAFQTAPELRGTKAGRIALNALEAAAVADLKAQGKTIHGIFTYTDYPAGQQPGNEFDIDPAGRIQMYARSGYPMIPGNWATPDEDGEALLLSGKVKGYQPYNGTSFFNTYNENGKCGPALEAVAVYLEDYNQKYYGMAFLGMIKNAADQLARQPGNNAKRSDTASALYSIHTKAINGEIENPHEKIAELINLVNDTKKQGYVATILQELRGRLDEQSVVKSMKAEQGLREEVVAQLVAYEDGHQSKPTFIKNMKPLMERFRDEFKIDFAQLRGKNVACVCGITLDEILPAAPVMVAQLKQVSGAPVPHA